MIGFAALERLGANGRVILSDVSGELLERCREIADDLGVTDRCEFVQAAADDLSVFGDCSVDVVTTRSVLIYVDRAGKRAALAEFHRVLRRGGRISSFEPINSFGYPEPDGRFWGYDVSAVAELAAKVNAHEASVAGHVLLDFDERDLLAWVEEAGFSQVSLAYEVEIAPRPLLAGMRWEAFLRSSGNPLDPTVLESVQAALTLDEQARFLAHLRPLVERSEGQRRMATAYLRAVR